MLAINRNSSNQSIVQVRFQYPSQQAQGVCSLQSVTSYWGSSFLPQKCGRGEGWPLPFCPPPTCRLSPRLTAHQPEWEVRSPCTNPFLASHPHLKSCPKKGKSLRPTKPPPPSKGTSGALVQWSMGCCFQWDPALGLPLGIGVHPCHHCPTCPACCLTTRPGQPCLEPTSGPGASPGAPLHPASWSHPAHDWGSCFNYFPNTKSFPSFQMKNHHITLSSARYCCS